MKSTLVDHVSRIAQVLRSSAPYVVLEILLPGGTLFALLLLIYQRRQRLVVVRPLPIHVVVAQAPGRTRSKLALVGCRDAAVPVARGLDGVRFGVPLLALPRAA